MNVVFVCAGNICRSPMAEALLKDKLETRGISSVQVSSCGLDTSIRDSAEPRLKLVIGNARRHLEGFHPRKISREIVRGADLMLAMEDGHVREILSRFPDSRGRVFTLTSYVGVDGEIVDFVDSPRENFSDWLNFCYATLDRGLDRLVDRIPLTPC